MKIVYVGNNQRGIECLKAIYNSKHDLAYAIAQEGGEGWYSSIKLVAENIGIPTSIENQPNNENLIKKLKNIKPDLIVMCGYSKIIGKEFRRVPEYGCINLHASKLPDYRGAAPLNWALINGEKEIGLSIYQVNAGVDTGPILAQHVFPVSLETTIQDVLDKTLEVYPKMLLEVCDQIEKGKTNPIIQNPNEGRYFTRRFPKDGEIKWDLMSDIEVYNLVRALTHPYPGAFFNYNNEKIYVWEAKLEEKNYHGISGRIASRQKDGIVVIAKNKGIKLTRVQPEGEQEINAKELFKKTAVDLK